MNFQVFKNAVAAKFKRMSARPLFRTGADKDDLWSCYLSSFPEGSNPMYRERTEHDCSCCKSFIRQMGNVVGIDGGKLVSIWDVSLPNEPEYQVVADALSILAKSHPVVDLFLHPERTAGTDKNFEEQASGTVTWHHFFVNIPSDYVMSPYNIPTILGKARSSREVFYRALSEITPSAVETVLELIAQNSLYRGSEHTFVLTAFAKHQRKFLACNETQRKTYVWSAKDTPDSVSHIRNSAIGTLLKDLSEDMDLEDAVKRFEAVVAPANYKRPTSLVTPVMLERAKKEVESLGLTSALSRRFATMADITVNNVLFADRAAKEAMTGSVFDDIAPTAPSKAQSFDKVEEIPIEKFLSEVLPKATGLEVMFENGHANNLFSLIAPEDPTAGSLFKWDSNFSWSYNGNMADSIKERVKAAGGSVEGDLCCRLAWDYTDDLDFHMHEPFDHIYFNSRRSRSGGCLDVDANGQDGLMENPVENIFYADKRKMHDGVYSLFVHNYCRRSDGIGFDVEIDCGGQLFNIHYPKVLRTQKKVEVARIQVTCGKITVNPTLPASAQTKKVWGISTNQFHRVSAVMLSPNHWDDKAVGNKHYFFIVEGCQNDGTARGFFNEFLKSELDKHRKVFELLGSKIKVADAGEQLSGLGFSSTKRNTLVCRVQGKFTRIVKVVF